MASSFVLGAFLLLAATLLQAVELRVSVFDIEGNPLSDAVVSATPLQGSSGVGVETQEPLPEVEIAQQNLQFVPRLTAIRRGTVVNFPNRDNILHNVYSFSKAKKFHLPLYRDEPPRPVTFDQPGAVVLGCNIHDWMVAYIYVLDTPHFAVGGANGRALLTHLPAGEYTVDVWHPQRKKRGSTPPMRLQLVEADHVQVDFTIALKPAWRQPPQQKGG